MSGMVLHAHRHELHGITVVLETTGPLSYIARFDTEDERGVHLINVETHDRTTTATSLAEAVARARRFGVKVDRKHLVVPRGEVATIRKLGEL